MMFPMYNDVMVSRNVFSYKYNGEEEEEETSDVTITGVDRPK